MSNYFIPNGDLAFISWLENFIITLLPLADKFVITAEEITSLQNDLNCFKYTNVLVTNSKTDGKAIVEFKNILRKGDPATAIAYPVPSELPAAPPIVETGINGRVVKIVNKIKASSEYNNSIGESLGIVSTKEVVDVNTLKPVITASVIGKGVLIGWRKYVTSGIDIYVDRGTGFQFLATDTVPDYIDTYTIEDGARSAEWKYKAIYRLGDEQVGMWSDVVSVAVKAEA